MIRRMIDFAGVVKRDSGVALCRSCPKPEAGKGYVGVELMEGSLWRIFALSTW